MKLIVLTISFFRLFNNSLLKYLMRFFRRLLYRYSSIDLLSKTTHPALKFDLVEEDVFCLKNRNVNYKAIKNILKVIMKS